MARTNAYAGSFLITVAVLIVVSGSANAEGTDFTPNVKPLVVAPRCDGGVRLDGNLDEDAWQTAGRAHNFAETSPGDQVRPPDETEVLVTWDDKHLYLGFVARDRRPSQIRASMRARDEIFQDDCVGVIIDTYANAAWAYELYANPFGIQGDRRWTPSGEDLGFDVVFDSEGRITQDGFQVEMAIPFKSLRFPNRDVQEWRVTFVRVHPRDTQRLYSWASISRDEPCYPCQFGTLSGIEGVQAGGSFELLPAAVGSLSA
ncbi:MAG: carbohydrate binding family 9 domain-containing protein [Candidatus Latescibacterota bacterium]|nr:MAG: carbohydrate binding family 9 domain-containing protein [Candidatus Latescibacterota bacterium]